MNSNKTLTMPCPGCNTILQFDAADLLAGKKIICTHCNANIGIDHNTTDALKDPLAQRIKLNKIMNDNKNNLNSDH